MDVHVRSLERADDLSAFCCDDEHLDRWFQRHAKSNNHQFGVTYLALIGQHIVGFVTVSALTIVGERQKGQPANIPGMLLARMAAHRDLQGRRLVGPALVEYVLDCAVPKLRAIVGCSVVVVDAKPKSVSFYNRVGFSLLAAPTAPGGTTRMVLAEKGRQGSIEHLRQTTRDAWADICSGK